MIHLKANDWFTITGRGDVALVSVEDHESVKIGDSVDIDGVVYRVRGIERTRQLTEPPTYRSVIGLQVVPV